MLHFLTVEIQSAGDPMNTDREANVVTGAYGYSGKYITQRMLDRGVSVSTLTGHPGRQNPFGDRVPAMPFNFEHPDALCESLRGAATVINTYWIRFEHDGTTFGLLAYLLELFAGIASHRAEFREFVAGLRRGLDETRYAFERLMPNSLIFSPTCSSPIPEIARADSSSSSKCLATLPKTPEIWSIPLIT
jgi:hypothetical protein